MKNHGIDSRVRFDEKWEQTLWNIRTEAAGSSLFAE